MESAEKAKELKDQNTFADQTNLLKDLYVASNLTRLQALYYFSQSMREESQLYNTIYTYDVRGEVDQNHFGRAFQSLVLQSDSFRMVVEEENGIPNQRLIENVPQELVFLDFSEEVNPEQEYETWLQERKLFGLELGKCSYDSVLVKLFQDRYIWYLNQHHMFVDANSFSVIFQRIAELYERSLKGGDLSLDGVPSFQEYVAYEHKYRKSAQYGRGEAYWREKLNNRPKRITFFGEEPRKISTKVTRLSVEVGSERSRKLREIAHSEGIFTLSEELSLYNLFAGMFFILLSQLSGMLRLGLVTPVHNRFTERLRNTIGLLIEFSPILVELFSSDTLESVINKVKRETREIMGYYQYGSGIVVDNNGLDVMFNTYTVPEMTLIGSSVHAERIHPGHGTESLALHVTDIEASGSFELHFDFHEDIFSPGQRDQIISAYLDLLDLLIEAPKTQVSDLDLLIVESKQDANVDADDQNKILEFERLGQTPPRDLLEFQILRIWEDVLQIDSIGVKDNFFDLGGNSFLAVKMFVELEKQTSKYLPLTTLLKAATVADIAKVIQEESGAEIWSNVITVQPGENQKPIYFAPGAAGNGLAIARITNHLGSERPVYMFQYPVGSERQQEIVHIEKMAEHYMQALRAVQPQGPYILGGYSAGGMVALEAAQQLQQQNQDVDLLVIVDVPAQSSNYKYVKQFTHVICSLIGLNAMKERKIFLRFRDLIFRLDYFSRRGFSEWVTLKLSRLRNFISGSRQEKERIFRKKFGSQNIVKDGEANPDSVANGSLKEGDQLWKKHDRHMREHFDLINDAVKSYIPQSYSGHVVLFKSTIGYRRPEMRMADPNMGWDRIVSGQLDVYEIPGNHMHIVREPNVTLLGRQLRVCLDSV